MAMLGVAVRAGMAADPAEPTELEFFEAKIRPLFAEHCYQCHSGESKPVEGGLRLDTAAGIRRGGESGPILVPGDAERSLLLAAVSYSPDAVNMPPEGKLPARALGDLRTWVNRGAALPPDSAGVRELQSRTRPEIGPQARAHWAFQPLAAREIPPVARSAWLRTRIDCFVLDRLEQASLAPAPQADKRTLLRRLSFDLTGLAPTADEVWAFAADESPDAFERQADRLLATPQYGERWGRHWLDVVRYGEDNPTSEATCKPPRFAYRYRDWVVEALNADQPYDTFVRRQLAADLMADLPPAELAATGLLGLSPVYHKEPKLSAEVIAAIVADEWDERIDTITRGLLGLTVACARCHDHKFDPIRTEDYYALAGVMASTQLAEQPLERTSPDVAAALQDTREAIVDTELRLSYAKNMRDTAKETGQDPAPFEAQISQFDARLKSLKERRLFSGPVANGVREAGLWIDGRDPAWTALDFRPNSPRDLPVFVRGNPNRPGAIVSRRFIEVLSPATPLPFEQGSGRLELAEAILAPAHGLAARVIVNRVWGWHFGQALVRTPSNFGVLGDLPSHPELLEDLAARFVADGWSLKRLHREIVASSSYRQTATVVRAAPAADPSSTDADNRLLWKMNRRRLEPESWRDAVLQASGELDLSMRGPSGELDDERFVRRTVYGKVSRQNVADVLRLFDFPDAKQHAEERITTTTPLQQLYLLNSGFMEARSAELARQAAAETSGTQEMVSWLFRRVLQRPPSRTELTAAADLCRRLKSEPEAGRLIAHGLLASNELLYVD